MDRSLTSTMVSVTRITSLMPSAPSSSMESSRLTGSPSSDDEPMVSSALGLRPGRSGPARSRSLGDHVADDHTVLADIHLLVPPGGQVLPHVVGPDRQL